MPLLHLLAGILHLGEDYAADEVIDTVAIGMDYGEARDLLQYGKARIVS